MLTLILLAHVNHRQASSVHPDVVLQHMGQGSQLGLPPPGCRVLDVLAVLLQAGLKVALIQILQPNGQLTTAVQGTNTTQLHTFVP